MVDFVVCAATAIEADTLLRVTRNSGASFELLVTGVGPVNAAMVLTRFLARTPARSVIALGVGGAYPGSGLKTGDVVCAESEYYADLGADSPDGFLDTQALGFPVVGGYYNRLPLGLFPAERRVPFVTLSTCTGQRETARILAQRTGGAVESMEGAAIVHVAIAHDMPVGEIRGISNMVTQRDSSTWKVAEAAKAAAHTLARWLEEPRC